MSVNLVTYPIIYVENSGSCSAAGYSPFGATYANPPNGCVGDAYVKSATATTTYTTPITIAAANDVVIQGPITTTEDASGRPTGQATLGLVANRYVRVEHGVTSRPNSKQKPPCNSGSPSFTPTTEVSGQYTPNLKLDVAILALQRSFIVDNYDCGSASVMQSLIIKGTIAQKYRGPVGLGEYWLHQAVHLRRSALR